MRILLGMSGGIDSTVAALLLQEQDYEVVGVTFQQLPHTPSTIHHTPSTIPHTPSTIPHRLGIEHHTLDFRAVFRERVIDNFVSEYACGRTPNPCVLCNYHIKWGQLLQVANELGCERIATGHYARIAQHRGHYFLRTAADIRKDQTYFLWMLTEEHLRRTVFPLGDLTKAQVRQIAFDRGFEQLSKMSESQDICFIPNNDYRAFLLEQGVSVPQGEFVDSAGKVLGMHQGYCHYTIGQRKGLGIALGSPKFVTKIDASCNRVTLGEREDLLCSSATIAHVRLHDLDWLTESPQVQARIRYKSPAVPARLLNHSTISFSTPVWGVTPGQSLVMYKDDLLVGGGIIQ